MDSDYESEVDLGDYKSHHAIPFSTVLVVEESKSKHVTFGSFDSPDNSPLWIMTAFAVSNSFRSELRLNGGWKRTIFEGDDNIESDQRFSIILNATSILSRRLESTAVSSLADLPEVVRQIPSVEVAIQRGRVRKVCITFETDKAAIAGLYAGVPTRDNERMAEDFRNLFHSKTVDCQLYLYGQDVITGYCDKLTRKLSGDRLNDPLDRWHPNHPGRHFVRLGQIAGKGDRPSGAYPRRNAFGSFGEYATIVAYGAIQEAECDETAVEVIAGIDIPMKAMTIPGQGDRRYIAFLMIDTSGYKLLPGDWLSVNFHDPDTGAHYWSARVIQPLQFTPRNMVTVILHHPEEKDEKTKEWIPSDVPINAIGHDFKTDAEARSALIKAPASRSRVIIELSQKTLKRQVKALQDLTQSVEPRHDFWRQVLIGKHVSPPKHQVDVYGELSPASVEDALKGLSLTQSQRAGVDHLRALPNGIGLFKGPPGTGKTHFIIEAILPLLTHPKATGPNKILILSPSNDPVDNVARAISTRTKQAGLDKLVIIRLHSWSSEEKLINQEGRSDPQQEPSIDDNLTDEYFAEFETAYYVYQMANEVTKKLHKVDDARMKVIDLSLGTWMMKRAGIIPDSWFCYESKELDRFQYLWKRFTEGRMYTQDEKQALRDAVKKLRVDVLNAAHVIVSTCSNAAEHAVFTEFLPDLVIIDEAGKAVELDLIIAMARYAPRAFVLVGDAKQLQPTVKSYRQRKAGKLVNSFASQLMLSPFERLIKLGHNTVLFREQHRMVTGLSNLPSRLFYRGQLVDAPSTLFSNREKASMIVQWMKSTFPSFNGTAPRLLLDVKKSHSEKQQTSTLNKETASVGATVLEHLISSGFKPGDIAIATPYEAQYNLYLRALRGLRIEFPSINYNHVRVRKIDGYQGGEAPVIILDLVVTTQAGFANNANRLNVALTRARDGLIIIGDVAQMNTAIRKVKHHKRYLTMIVKDFQYHECYVAIKEGNVAFCEN